MSMPYLPTIRFTFDYPQELRTNQELVRGMHAFFQEL